MAVQNALVQISISGTPSTAAMTTNVTHFMLDLGEMLLGGDQAAVAKARQRADELQGRLKQRLEDLNAEQQLSSLPPVVTGGALVVPVGLLSCMRGATARDVAERARERSAVERAAVDDDPARASTKAKVAKRRINPADLCIGTRLPLFDVLLLGQVIPRVEDEHLVILAFFRSHLLEI